MKIFKLDKTVIQMKGQAARFLNGLTSNTLTAFHNAFLNIHGRIIATTTQYVMNDDEVWQVVASSVVEELIEHLKSFAALNGTILTLRPEVVYFDVEGTAELVTEDIRLPQKAGALLITSRNLLNTVSEEEFTLFRLRHGIALQGIDYHQEMILNVSMNDYVSFTKGCFLGQEPVSKVYHRSKPTWQLEVVPESKWSLDGTNRATSVIFDPEVGERQGFLFMKKS